MIFFTQINMVKNTNNIKALILVGGQGTRLHPLTINRPKSMMPVANIPLIEHVINNLKSHGITDIVLAQGHLSQPIGQYLGNGSKYGVELTYSQERKPLGTAGAVKNAEDYLSDTFLVLNGDIFSDLDFSEMIEFHKKNKAKITIALTPVSDPSSYGLVNTGEGEKITSFLEKPSAEQITTNMINAGTYVMEKSALSNAPKNKKWSFEKEVFPSLLEAGESLYAFKSNAYWIDIGRPEHYAQLNYDLLNGKCKTFKPDIKGEDSPLESSVLLGDNCKVGASAVIEGPSVIGANCIICEDAYVKASIIWEDTQIHSGAYVLDSVVANMCNIGENSKVEKTIIGNNTEIPKGYHTKPGSHIRPGANIC